MVLINGLDRVLEFIPATKAEIKRAGRNAVNATATFIKKRAIERISGETGLNPKTVKAGVSTKSSGQDVIESLVLASNKRPPLSAYKFSVVFSGSRGTVSSDISMLRRHSSYRESNLCQS